jgi:hypothetical protein
MRSLLAILLLLSGYGLELRAQDLTGQWTGTATDNGSGKKQKLVLTIAESDSALGGVLHWYFPETEYIRHLIVSGRFYKRDSVLTIREDSVMNTNTTGVPDGRNPGFYVLYFRRTAGHKDILEGNWRDPARSGQKAGDLVIRLEKKAPPFIPVVTMTHKKKDSLQSKQYQALLTRQSFTAATIPIRGLDSVKIELYDNGEIDGDSVSLYLNGELLIGHLKLTASPKTLLLPIDRSLRVNKLILFAENLGRLPPNTALMEITVNGKIYNLFMSTDYKKNAMVEFTFQE